MPISNLRVQVPLKLEPLFYPKRYKIAYGGRGAGKSWGVARALLIRGIERPTRILCTREIQNSIADSVHKLLSDQISILGLDEYTIQETRIFGRNGTEFLFAGLRQQDINKMKSFEGVDIAWVEEAQAVTHKSWEVLIPTIRKEDSEIWVTFNPDLETDDTYDRFVLDPPRSAQLIPMSWRDNPWFTDTMREEMETLKRKDFEAYENVWEGKCKTIVDGAIFGKEMMQANDEGRITSVPHDSSLSVNTYWDLGIGDAMAIWFEQHIGGEIRLIDYHEASGEGFPYYAKIMAAKPYNYGKHWAPHDIEVRELGSGRSRQETARQLGINFNIVPRLGSGDADACEERIHAARLMLPRCWFDKDRCKPGLHALRSYRRDFNTRLDEFKTTPLHDWASHGADAFGHMAVSLNENAPRKPKHYEPDRAIPGGWMRG